MSFGLSVKKEGLYYCACVHRPCDASMVQACMRVQDTRRRGSMNVAICSPAHFLEILRCLYPKNNQSVSNRRNTDV